MITMMSETQEKELDSPSSRDPSPPAMPSDAGISTALRQCTDSSLQEIDRTGSAPPVAATDVPARIKGRPSRPSSAASAPVPAASRRQLDNAGASSAPSPASPLTDRDSRAHRLQHPGSNSQTPLGHIGRPPGSVSASPAERLSRTSPHVTALPFSLHHSPALQHDGINPGADAASEHEEEPRLKYQHLGADLESVLRRAPATCLCVSDKVLALGTSAGNIHLLDYDGNQVREIKAHKGAAITDMSFDEAADNLASCAHDGSILISGLYTDETTSFKHKHPLKTIALDPRYTQRKTREFVSGGVSGELILHSRGWLGIKDTILHCGEGTIQSVCWNGSLIAWSNALSVKVYDTSAHQRIFTIKRPDSARNDKHAKPHLYWESDTLLYVGWGSTVTVARVVLLEEPSTVSSVQSHVMQVLVSRDVEGCILGVSPFGQDIALLTQLHPRPTTQRESADAVATSSSVTPSAAAAPSTPAAPSSEAANNAAADLAEDVAADASTSAAPAAAPLEEPYPEMKILSWKGDELASDVLPIVGLDPGAPDYSATLATYYPLSKERTMQADRRLTAPKKAEFKWWPDGYEPLYYIITPRDVVVGRPRDGDDRVAWLLQRRRFKEALTICATDRSLRQYNHEQVADLYLKFLMRQRQYQEAAALCPQLLKENAAVWERQVYTFGHARQLPTLAPFLPTSSPQLRRQAYEMVLTQFLMSPAHHHQLLPILQHWPSHVYSVTALTEATLNRMKAQGGGSPELMGVAAHLYTLQGRADLAMAILLRLKQPDILSFIVQHGLYQAAGAHAVDLMRIDAVSATHLLVEHADEVPPHQVVHSLQAAIEAAEAGGREQEVTTWRQALHTYLDSLFQRDTAAGAAFADLQVQLYAEFQPDALLPFLTSSHAYSLEKALEVCEQRGLVSEQVHVLGRMGAAARALELIISRLSDVPAAIAFVHGQNDDEELWQHLIQLALRDPESTGQLLDSIGGYVNPLQLVQQIPAGMSIPALRDRLVHIIAEFRTQTSLSEGCNAILRHDCVVLAQRMYREVQRALRSLYVRSTAAGAEAQQWQLQQSLLGQRSPVREADLPPAVTSSAFNTAASDNEAQSSAGTVGSKAAVAVGEPPPQKVWVGIHMVGSEDAGLKGALKRWRSAHTPHSLALELPSLVV